MDRKEYKEENIESLLSQLPVVNDDMDRNDLYQKVSARLSTNKSFAWTKFKWIIPTFAALTVLFLLVLLIPPFVNQSNEYSKEADMQTGEASSANSDTGSTASNSTLEEEATIEKADQTEESERIGLTSDEKPDFVSHVLNQTIDGMSFIQSGVLDTNAQYLIPISFRVPSGYTRMELYNRLPQMIQEEEWGVYAFPLNRVSFTLNKGEEQVTMRIPEKYSLNEGYQKLYVDLLSYMFTPLKVSKVKIEQTGNETANFGMYGNVNEIELEPLGKQSYFVYQVSENKPQFLVAVPQDKESTLEEALQFMQVPVDTPNISPSIQKEMLFTVETYDQMKRAKITVSNQTKLRNNQTSLNMIESIMMTAKSYGYETVTFDLPIQKIGPYEFTEELPVPVAANPMPFTE
ncbi:hypothetical protein NC797_09930 [Aquibacillus sp. 3ASR75-11]|uniref:Sigma-X negative effector n=1 Tax=Terrihalobacillus insolitus TaxID=2950438 RepID=A0A9X3WWS6_9BACI|nr:hypothetical protein [Terrihalobacillus insolitus]MDC3413087.1 hypothetical protein [Terrihalobacillus insolitus]MDC3424829.1 hypothetical protein [Terrihalobacillus insolitus]